MLGWHSACLQVGPSFTVGYWWWANTSFACHLFPGGDPGVTSTIVMPCNIPLFSVGSLKSFLYQSSEAGRVHTNFYLLAGLFRGNIWEKWPATVQKAHYKAALFGCKGFADALAFASCLWRCCYVGFHPASGHTPELAHCRGQEGLVNPCAEDCAVPTAAEVCFVLWLCQGSSGHCQTFKIHIYRLRENWMGLVRVFSIIHRLDTGNVQLLK